jgi:plastocyanin
MTPTAPEPATTRRRRAAGRHGRLRLLGAAGLIGMALTLAACSSSGSSTATTSGSTATTSGSTATTSGSTASSTDAITIQNFSFHPSSITVAPGATVTVTNKDQVAHTITSSSGAFNTGDVAPGQSKTFTAPNKAGSYPYICSIHQYMSGTLVVS